MKGDQVRYHLPLTIATMVLVSLVFVHPALKGQNQEIADREAASHVGETLAVRGTVANVHTSRAGNTFLNFGPALS